MALREIFRGDFASDKSSHSPKEKPEVSAGFHSPTFESTLRAGALQTSTGSSCEKSYKQLDKLLDLFKRPLLGDVLNGDLVKRRLRVCWQSAAPDDHSPPST